MDFKPLTKILRKNAGRIITGLFLLGAAFINNSKETPAPAPAPNINITVNTPVAAPVAPAAPDTVVHMHQHYHHYDAPQPRKPYPKPVAKPLLQPSCPCADSTKAGA